MLAKIMGPSNVYRYAHHEVRSFFISIVSVYLLFSSYEISHYTYHAVLI